MILDTLSGKPLHSFQTALQIRDGSWINISMSTVLVHDPHGKIIGVLRIIEELSDRTSINASYDHALQLADPEAIASFASVKANTLLDQYKIGQRNFAGLNLRGAYFAEADLQQVDFSGVALNGSNCSHVNFQHANLRGADLRGANFQYADLKWADLSGADTRGTNLENANMTGVTVDDSDDPKGTIA